MLTAVMALGFLAGAAALLYPCAASLYNGWRDAQILAAYDEQLAASEDAGDGYADEWAAARAYNDALDPVILPDSFAQASEPYTDDEAYASVLDVTGTGLMGSVSIPAIGVEIPLYHSTEEQVLAKGAGHLLGSHLPIGGEGTHAVIAAHCGLPGNALFTDLDQLEAGDVFYIDVLDETLAYEVDLISVVEPDDTSLLVPEEGQDYVTLVTCTPYGVNTQRLLVRGHRIAYDADEQAATAASKASLKTSYALWALAGIAVAAVVLVAFDRRLRRRSARRARRAGGGSGGDSCRGPDSGAP